MSNIVVESGVVNSMEIRRSYEESHFLDEKYDAAIMGVNPLTGGIIYHYYQLIHMEIDNSDTNGIEEDSDEWNDLYDQCMEVVNSMFYNLELYAGDLTAPTLLMELDTL